ncbi:MAG: single-stranded DNA-binding protein [Candidatus Margulisiibacteriota bacterium]|nr:single-stranded DNA-binding protein [Candidatus Margulisiibacteriota bacterium]
MYNKAFLIGNLTRDPELRYTTSGIPVARFAIAVNRFKRKDADGEGGQGINRDGSYQDVDFINIVAWRRLAEICGEYLKKGRPVAIEGCLQIRSFKGRDGEMRTMSEVVADNMQMLGRRQEGGTPAAKEAPAAETPADEIPF